MAAIVQSSAIKYSPLSNPREIRLVMLEPGSDDDPLSCRLFHAELGKRAYEALSYEWGDASREDPEILINGKEVQIRQNLSIALSHLRLENDERCLWIDAMCIDQSNVLERNHQVELMGRIYSESKSTIAWLGLPMNDSELAMDRMIEFEALVETEGRHRIAMSIERADGHSDSGSRLNASMQERRISFLVTTVQLDAVIAIAIRSYWSRMWIIQEIQLPSHLRLHCGRKSISPLTFLSFLKIESADKSSYGYNLGGTIAFFLLDRRRSRERTQHKSCHQKDGLHDWLSGCLAQPLSGLAQPFSSTEPRDIVYALLGVSSDCQNGQLKPDYAKPVLEVYKDVFNLPARRRWKETRSKMSTSQNIICHESVLDNNLALRLGLINKDRYLENERRVAQMLAVNWNPGHLVWPSGRFPRGLWDVREMCFGTVSVVLAFLTAGVSYLFLFPLFYLWILSKDIIQKRVFVT